MSLLFRIKGSRVLLLHSDVVSILNEVTDNPFDRFSFWTVPGPKGLRKRILRRMKSYLRSVADADWNMFRRRYVFRSWYGDEAKDAFPELLEAYAYLTRRAAMGAPPDDITSVVTRAQVHRYSCYCVCVLQKRSWLWYAIGLPARTTTTICIPTERIEQLSGTVHNFFIGGDFGRAAFRRTGVEVVLYEANDTAIDPSTGSAITQTRAAL